jgi:hypothetical protein
MTLTVTLINQHGIWQSADCRLTHRGTGAVVDDFSVKQVGFKCPDGRATLAYAGSGSFYSAGGIEIHLSDWIRQFIRGETYTVEQTLLQIRKRATEDLGHGLLNASLQHMFIVGAHFGGKLWQIQIRNFSVTREHGVGPLQREFVVATQEARRDQYVVCPWPWILSRADFDLLMKVGGKRPRKPKEFSDLLAGINLRTANANRVKYVSPQCITTYLPVTETDGMQNQCHNFPPDAPSIVVPFLLFGIDGTETMRRLMDAMAKGVAPESAGAESVTPRNILQNT